MHVDWLLIMKYFQGGCSEEELLDIENWRTSDPSHQKFFDELAEIWHKTGNLYSNYEPDKKAAWNKMAVKLSIEKKIEKSGISNNRIYLRWAAIILLLVSLSFILYFLFPGKEEIQLTSVYKSGKSKAFYMLPDSSLVTLNKNAKLLYISKPGSSKREVKLDGSAYFEIKADKQNPFFVYYYNIGVEVVGTDFYLDYDTLYHKIILIVTSGVVKFFEIADPTKFILTNTNEKSVFDIRNGKMYKVQTYNPNEIAWKTGIFIFEKTRLDSICNVLSKYYELNIKLSDTIMNSWRLTGGFHNQPLQNIIEAIKVNFDINAYQTNDTVVLSIK